MQGSGTWAKFTTANMASAQSFFLSPERILVVPRVDDFPFRSSYGNDTFNVVTKCLDFLRKPPLAHRILA